MERGISHATANESLVNAARNVVQHDFGHIQSQVRVLVTRDLTFYEFILPTPDHRLQG